MKNLKKKSQVENLLNILKEKSNFALVKIEKTTHQNLEILRKNLKKNKSNLKVIKNTFFEKAINKLTQKNPLFKELKNKFFPLKETSALITFDENFIDGLKSFFEFSQKEKSLSFRFSLLDKNIYDHLQTEKIAQLPSKNQLIAKLISSFKSPVNKFVYSLKYNTNKLVYILKQKAK